MSIALIAALDTKAADADFLAARLREHGHAVTVIDVGVLDEPGFVADVPRERVAAAGGVALSELAARADRSAAMAVMAAGATSVLAELHARGSLSGALAIGGGAGTTIGAAALRDLPLGLPKVVLSTFGGSDPTRFVGTSDVVMFPSIVDLAGLNRISAITYARAADALSGMVQGARDEERRAREVPLVAATMFGVTTPCVLRAKARLEAAGCEVLIFHATGVGGRMMERLVAEGLVDAVLDVTTTEWADEVVGGILTAGPHRLEAAARCGVPQVVSLGATDMVNFGPLGAVPARFRHRRLFEHTEASTLLRVTESEAAVIGAQIGRKLRSASAPATVVIPGRGVSELDRAGGPFEDPCARAALSEAVLAEVAGSNVSVEEHDLHINDAAFADLLADRLLESVGSRPGRRPGAAHTAARRRGDR